MAEVGGSANRIAKARRPLVWMPIRAHAAEVGGFVRDGMPAMMGGGGMMEPGMMAGG
ncbi:hypothetical protein [Mycolicibacterium fortuitum]|uniref:hypothetical protein n=1 Tax=Mycolicibacterium fortuitum TaxID=1766 RepID=UPI00031DD084|nr:hypothetical protein [Mycolicibacterium fortuitum]AJR29909.1 hypothetical protein G155_00038 [Mycobacterium sp. VKM Ac-1817D]CRL80674.1 hypothetical protein CPGR_03881 [Mycolicibacter nonchromogenicus]WEV36078.1 hypothetical protein OMF10_02225 [Mycolicibacterium fortuitum]CRL56681.1 hypothetical protein CPGR_04005 [Mycolicibacterium fortuitum subsp. fortuitum DSM 46621 = ATCC 6841 = JCM 6387]BDD96355.1 hypothetical protein MFTT_04490 [Mycolicibacterium fortuitum subsp. fortuitum]